MYICFSQGIQFCFAFLCRIAFLSDMCIYFTQDILFSFIKKAFFREKHWCQNRNYMFFSTHYIEDIKYFMIELILLHRRISHSMYVNKK